VAHHRGPRRRSRPHRDNRDGRHDADGSHVLTTGSVYGGTTHTDGAQPLHNCSVSLGARGYSERTRHTRPRAPWHRPTQATAARRSGHGQSWVNMLVPPGMEPHAVMPHASRASPSDRLSLCAGLRTAARWQVATPKRGANFKMGDTVVLAHTAPKPIECLPQGMQHVRLQPVRASRAQPHRPWCLPAANVSNECAGRAPLDSLSLYAGCPVCVVIQEAVDSCARLSLWLVT
jgi:hypothetical protein